MRALEEQSIAVIRLNTDDFLTHWEFTYDDGDLRLESANCSFKPSDVQSVYYRRATTPHPKPDSALDTYEYIVREAIVMLRSLYAALTCPWISHYNAIALAENKPRQLQLAKGLGLHVPPTIITSNAGFAKQFFNTHAPVVHKAVSHGTLGNGSVLHTTLLESWDELYTREVALVPHLFQRYIEKRFEYRVTVIDHQVFACRIDSQAHPAYRVDMRRGLPDFSMLHELCEIPREIGRKCVDLVSALNLRFGAIDLVEDESGTYWFLEVNPNGQWAWIEDRIGAPLSQTIAESLATS